ERAGLVVVADSFYPGWEARVDDRPTPIFPANVMFRAVAVPAGTHTITFRYRPRAFHLGCALFVLAALACLALARRMPLTASPS
ncbi:MAG TPA: YfhO family protein, partial [Candidatus Binatia bacterium]|nr:YfhO family protein [Candidatus Binatia bacterium]